MQVSYRAHSTSELLLTRGNESLSEAQRFLRVSLHSCEGVEGLLTHGRWGDLTERQIAHIECVLTSVLEDLRIG